MSEPVDLYSTIEDALTDATLPAEPEPAVDDTPAEPVEAAPAETPSEPAPEVSESVEVKSPSAKAEDDKPLDDFEKTYGIPRNSATGRENRIPYTRVEKITAKAKKDTEAKVRAEYTPKITDYETKVKSYETKVNDYEARLQQVGQVEQLMVKDHAKFLEMLVTRIPGYAEILSPLWQQPQTKEAPTQPVNPSDEMPQPDEKLTDGSMVYSLEGLGKRDAWNRAQAKKEVLDEVSKRFGPIEKEWQQHQQIQQTLPKVQAQVTAARQWPQFQENEAEIVRALQTDRSLSLEGAYNRVVVPKLVAAKDASVTDMDKLRNDVRAQLLKELKTAPRSTSASTGGVKPNPQSSGKRSLEDIIKDSLSGINR